ncbi:helix-turn-helix transcriptional regulator [Ligilactobacillus ruminis]|uniref:helix-turn-helix domain-containing protein n=1 Tax=Ligilactobacillus ruminis TaxID=1623 RepID=UPI001F486C08|nr:helix-turn-helix transcriptional regulator [Ligilactobacillus ruminis]MCF2543718.1 helix-turn-helix transcriptional regulator [Ligilactobacillus ruminis]MDD5957929.1 helix-turn-helix transcriptional regulator [Ligilactobacillus ruminis]
MALRDNIKDLAAQKKISVAELERTLGFGNGSISKWNKQSPSADKLKKVADYFGVTIDYLLDRKPAAQTNATIEEALDSVMSYDGKPITDNDREVLRGIIEGYLKNKKD